MPITLEPEEVSDAASESPKKPAGFIISPEDFLRQPNAVTRASSFLVSPEDFLKTSSTSRIFPEEPLINPSDPHVSGMELLGGTPPGPAKPPQLQLPWETKIQQPTPGAERDIPTRILDIATGGIGKAAQGIERTAGPLESFVIGKPGEAGMPRQSTMTPAQGKELAGGAADVISGTLAAATPLVGGGIAAAPLHTLVTLAAGTMAQKGVKAGLDKLGVAPEYADLAAEIAALLAGYAAAKGRLSPQQQNLIEVLRGQESPGAHQVESLKAMADRGGTVHERNLAREFLKRKFGVDYGTAETESVAPEKPLSEMSDAELNEHGQRLSAKPPDNHEAQAWEVEREFRRRADKARRTQAAPIVDPTAAHVEPEAATPVDVPATQVVPQPEVPVPVTESQVAPPVPQVTPEVPQAIPPSLPVLPNAAADDVPPLQSPTLNGIQIDPRLQSVPDADLAGALDHLNKGNSDFEADEIRAELERRTPGLNLRTVKWNGAGYLIEGDPAGTIFPTESSAVRALIGIPEPEGAEPALPNPDFPQIESAATPQPMAVTAEEFLAQPEASPPPAAPQESEVVKPKEETAPETAANGKPNENEPETKPVQSPATTEKQTAVSETKTETNKFASTQVNLLSEIAEKSKAFAATIPKESLIGDGIEQQPHITVRFGNNEDDHTRIAAALAKQGPITAKIKGVSIFPNVDTEHGKADVVKLDIDSPDLHRLNALMGKAVPHPGETFPQYKPHITVAYLRAGEGKKYAGRLVKGLSGQTVTFNSVAFSPKSGPQVEIPLKASVQEKPAPPGPIPSGIWMNDGEIEQALDRYKDHPVLSMATKFLNDFQEEVNSHSDGWPYWKLPSHAAQQLMGMIQHPEYATQANFTKSLGPIRAFYTRHGNAAGMKFPAIEGIAPATAKKSAAPSKLLAKQEVAAETKAPSTETVPPTSETSPKPLTPAEHNVRAAELRSAAKKKAAAPEPQEGPTISKGEGNAATEPEPTEPRPESVRPEDRKPLEEQLPEGEPSAGEGGPVAAGGNEGGRVRKPSKRAGQKPELEPSGGTVSGVVGDPAEPERTFPPRAQDVVSTHHDRDYRIPDGRIISGSPEARARNNIESIKVLRQIQAENRLATVEEQSILAGYVGWGAVPQLFAGRPEFLEMQKELKSLLSEEEYDSAQRSTTNAHYTGDMVVDSMWSALKTMGAKPGMSWLEPAVGVGNFFGRQPQELLEGARRVGLDKDSVSGQIAKALYPDSGIDAVAYEDAELPKDYFDGAVSNIPFGNFGVSDPEFRGKPFLTNPIHNYFFAKTLGIVRPGGVVAFVTSRYTMDGYEAGHANLRKWIAERAHLIGAIRLPSGAFSQNAGTSVITDIIFLRKKLPGEESMGATWQAAPAKSFKSLQQYGGSYQIPVNEYYHANPSHVLGEEGLSRGQFSDHDYSVKGSATPAQIATAVASFPKIGFEKFTPEKKVRTVAVRDVGTAAERSKLGGLFFNDKGELFRKTSKGAAEGVQATGPTKKRIRGQLAIRDILTKLTSAELADHPEAELNGLRKNLNRAYDNYVNANGPLSSQSNAVVMRGDPDAPLLLSLERRFAKGNKSKGLEATVEKAPIFERRMLRPPKTPTSVSDPKEALYISLNEKGRLDFDRMSELTGKTVGDLQRDLAGLVYQDPHTKIWQTAEEYLSGSVRKKFKQAKAIAKIEPEYQGNVEALDRVQPTDVPPGEIRALLGITWVPIDRYSEFAADMLGADNPSRLTVKYAGGNWIVDNAGTRLGASQKWSTARVSGLDLLSDTLNMRRTKVYDRDSDGTTTINQAETKSARARQMEMQDHFERWLFADPKRGDELVRIYNDTQNDLRLRTFDGAHLTLPGMTRDAIVVRGGDLDPHQKAAVWRQIVQPNVLLAHAVGVGKTFEMIAGGMELQRLGLIRRPMYVVPNATLTSWQDQFAALYPQKRVLVFSEKDLERSKRQQMMAQVATGDWDAVVVPHSSFQFLATGDEMFEEHFQKLSAELEESIKEAGEAGLDTRQIKRMEKAKETLLTNLKNKRNADKKDQTVTWEQLGIDQLFVDESHEYKKLGFSTKQGNVAGIDQEGNQKTFDLFMKMRHVQKHGRGIVFATGTPVTNTMGELYSIQKYLIEPELQARGIGKFDEWSANFGRTVDVFEPKIEGGGYQLKARFAQFVNLPELAQLFRSFADVVTSDMVDIPRPELIGGKRLAVETQLTDAQADYLENVLRPRALAIRASPRKAMPDNMLSVYTDAQKMALDLRMVDPGAPDDPRGRLNEAADLIRQYWEESADIKGTQVVFSDLGKPAEAGGSKEFSVYDELIKKMVERGIPREEIAHIYQAKNKTQRAKLFQDVNDGKIRVVLGSTMKLGVGVNMQKRLFAAHHLDVPHRPSDLEQREGRIMRQGNLNPAVHIRYYVTKGSLDESKFANVVRKAKFINQVIQGKSEVREAEDVGGMVPSLEMFQAMASGDHRVMRKMEVDAEVDRLSGVYSGWKNQQYKIRSDLAQIPGRMAWAERSIADIRRDMAVRDKTGNKWQVGKQKLEGDKLSVPVDEALSKAITRVFNNKMEGDVEIGTAHGLPITAAYTYRGNVGDSMVQVEIGDTAKFTVTGDNLAAVNFYRRISNKLEDFESDIASKEKTLQGIRSEQKGLESAVETDWPYAKKFQDAVEEQSRLIKDLGGNKDDESASAVGEGGEISDVAVQAEEQAPSEDDEEEEDVIESPGPSVEDLIKGESGQSSMMESVRFTASKLAALFKGAPEPTIPEKVKPAWVKDLEDAMADLEEAKREALAAREPTPIRAETPPAKRPPAMAPAPQESEFPHEIKPSKLAHGVESKAVENNLTAGFHGIPEYETVNVREQAQMAADLLRDDHDLAIRIAMGRALPPNGLLPESVFVAVENQATANGDVELLRDLATASTLSMEATGMGQRIRMLAERSKDSPVGMMQQVLNAREAAATKRYGPKAKAKIKTDIKESIRTQNKQKGPWILFIESIKC